MQCYDLNLKIIKNLGPVETIWWNEKCMKMFESHRRMRNTKSKILNQKFNKPKTCCSRRSQVQLNIERESFKNCNTEKKNYVINLSNQDFSVEELNLLQKGLKYIPPPKKAPFKELTVNI